MSLVYRTREVVGNRLTFSEAQAHPDEIAWRAISAARRYGQWEYLFDDLVRETNLTAYVLVVVDRGAERITLHRTGTIKETLERSKGAWTPMRGTSSIAAERKIAKLDDPRFRRRRRRA